MEKWIKRNKNRILKDLADFIKIESIQNEPEKNKPFGKGVDDALNYILKYAEQIGLKTVNLDNYIGYADWGKGDEILGILCHIDIVPPGSGWDSNPYELQIRNNKMIGRGVLDDKGPTLQILNAVKYLKEKGFEPQKKVRIIFGTNEESGWEGINHYLERKEMPDLSFTPDAEFPVIFAEKGILQIEFFYKESLEEFVEIKGGDAPNMVPNYAFAVVDKNKNFEKKEKIKIKKENKRIKIEAEGKSAHASTPELGENAISKLLVYLSEYYDNPFFNFFKENIGYSYNGEKLNIDYKDEESGKLSFNVGLLKRNKLIVDIRFPVSYKKEKIIKKIRKQLPEKIGLNVKTYKAPLYVDKNSELVKSLMEVYNKVDRENAEPIAIGGGTYARAVDNGVAFGPLFPEEEEVAHQANEYVMIDSFFKSFRIYTRAIKTLVS
jgi:succinyl-diaminopimelate desuccinylase